MEAEGWDERDGKEVSYFFLGNAVLTLGDLNEAAGYYQRALDLNPEYAARPGRRRTGRLPGSQGQVCSAIDEAGLRRAIADTQAALTARDQPAVSDVGVKAAYQIGRAELCLSLAGSESGWIMPRRSFCASSRNAAGPSQRPRAS